MNERIDKLLVKAGAYFGGEGVDYSNFDPNKFAELIVRECIELNNQELSFNAFERLLNKYQNHFGVEL